MAVVRTLTTKWGFQVNDKPLKEMKLAIAEMKNGIKGLAMEASGAALAIFAFAEHTAKAGKAASLGASRSGMGAEDFQKLAFAAKTAGVDADGLTISLGHMNRTIFAAKSGNKEATHAFAMLGGGVYQAALRGAPTKEIFAQIADKISKMTDVSKQGALAQQIFGRAGIQLLPLLKKGAHGIAELGEEAEEMGLILSKDAVIASGKFRHALHEMESRVLGIKNTIGVALLEPITHVLEAMAKWVKMNRALITQNLTAVIRGMSFAVTVAIKVFGAFISRLNELAAPLGGVGEAAGKAFAAFALFKAAEVLHGLGKAIMSVKDLGLAFQLLGDKGLLASAKTAAIPILIAAAFLLMVAAVEDIVGYFQGKDSVFGSILSSFDEVFEGLSARFSSLGGFLKATVAILLSPFNMLLSTIKAVSGAIGAISGGGGIRGAWAAIKDSVNDVVAPFTKIANRDAGSITLADATGISSDKVNRPNFADMAGMDGKPSAAQMVGPGGAGGNSHVEVNTSVVVPPGTDPHMVGDRVEDGVAKGLGNVLRPANKALSTGIKH